MKKLLLVGAAAVALCAVASPSFAGTPQTASDAWNDVVGFSDANQQAADANDRAINLEARKGGFGSPITYETYNNFGNQTSTTTFTGSVTTTSSGATDNINDNQVGTTITGSPGSGVTVSTGQTSGSASQVAKAGVQSTTNGNNTGSQ